MLDRHRRHRVPRRQLRNGHGRVRTGRRGRPDRRKHPRGSGRRTPRNRDGDRHPRSRESRPHADRHRTGHGRGHRDRDRHHHGHRAGGRGRRLGQHLLPELRRRTRRRRCPVHAGDPGHGRHLDRDRDGVGCEQG
ncbi:excalibur calcium-binding domain-containing protein [Streptomyces sp. NPDC059165]